MASKDPRILSITDAGLVLPNTVRPAPAPAPTPEISAAKRPEDYILEANSKAQARTGFVGRMGEQLFQEQWKTLVKTPALKDEEIQETMDECIAVAEMWRKTIDGYQRHQAETIHNAEVQRWSASGIILPTWGEIKDHFPGAHQMFGGN